MHLDVDNIFCTVTCTPAELEKLTKLLSTYAPGYRYTHLYKRKKWDGKVSLVNGVTFPTGLLLFVADKFPSTTIQDNRQINVPVLNDTTVPLRPYQWEAVQKAFGSALFGSWWPRGVLKIATGGGKTEIAAAMIEMADVPTLFLVHRTELVDQAIERFAKYGVSAGKIAAGTFDLQKVTVATIQSLMSFQHQTNEVDGRTEEDIDRILKKKAAQGKRVRAYLKGIEQVFVDEAHLVAASLDKGNLFTQALQLMPNAYMRWGLTATAFMKDEYCNWLLEGSTGSTLYEIRSRELIDMGYLAEPKITMYRMKVKTYGDWVADYDEGIVVNTVRNERIVKCIEENKGPIMVLVQKIAHGNELVRLCNREGLDVEFLHGSVSVEDRQDALERLKSGELHAVIGSTIWDEGLDVAEIATLILAGGGKSKIKNLQRLGRGLRRTEEKVSVQIVDFFEEGSKWLRRHAMARRKLWLDEKFVVKMVE